MIEAIGIFPISQSQRHNPNGCAEPGAGLTDRVNGLAGRELFQCQTKVTANISVYAVGKLKAGFLNAGAIHPFPEFRQMDGPHLAALDQGFGDGQGLLGVVRVKAGNTPSVALSAPGPSSVNIILNRGVMGPYLLRAEPFKRCP
jgi:hypothetical protein